MAAQAWMLGAWIFVENPGRSENEDLNLTVGGTIYSNTEALRLLGEQLLTVKIEVYDHDTFSADDLLATNSTFQFAVHDTDFHCFHTPVISPTKRSTSASFGMMILQKSLPMYPQGRATYKRIPRNLIRKM